MFMIHMDEWCVAFDFDLCLYSMLISLFNFRFLRNYELPPVKTFLPIKTIPCRFDYEKCI